MVAEADQRLASARDFGSEVAAFQAGYEDGRFMQLGYDNLTPEQVAGIRMEGAALAHAFATMMLGGQHPAIEDDEFE